MVRFSFKLFLCSLLFLCLNSSYSHLAEPSFAREDIDCLAKNIYHEARGEPLLGQVAVAHVTLNRLKSGRFPKTICSVVLQKNQFSWVSPKKLKERTDPEAEYLAIKILSGKYSDPTEGSLFFHAKNVEPFKRKRVKKIGNHIFYR